MSIASPTSEIRRLPRLTWAWIGAALMVAGVLTFLVVAGVSLKRVADRVDNFPELKVPGAYEVSFSKIGTYLIYRERPSGDHSEQPKGLKITVLDAQGKAVPLAPYNRDVAFSFSGHRAGIALYKMEIATAGNYRVDVTDNGDGNLTLLVGTSVIHALVGPLLVGGAAGAALFVVGLVVLIRTMVRRRRVKRLLGVSEPVWAPGAPPVPFGAPAPPANPSWNPPPGPAPAPPSSWMPPPPAPTRPPSTWDPPRP
jgi:hypothetical protein